MLAKTLGVYTTLLVTLLILLCVSERCRTHFVNLSCGFNSNNITSLSLVCTARMLNLRLHPVEIYPFETCSLVANMYSSQMQQLTQLLF